MPTYRMLIEYEGTRYHGWQVQPDRITVQQVIEEALQTLLKEQVRIQAAGRTDAGVHAVGQVASFITKVPLDRQRFLRSVNALTPYDIAILDVKAAPDEFNARRWATGREYRYFLINRDAPSAVKRHFSWHVPVALDIDAMRQAAGHLIGEHDFASFCASGCDSKTTLRTMRTAALNQRPDGFLEFVFLANGFLKSMVRAIVGTLHQIGLGKIPAGEIEKILSAGDRTEAGPTAPARGLFFTRVDYSEDLEPLAPQQGNFIDGSPFL